MTPVNRFLDHVHSVGKKIKCSELYFNLELETEVKYLKDTFISPEGETDDVEMPYCENKRIKITSTLPQNYTEAEYQEFIGSLYVNTSRWRYDQIDEMFGTIWFEDGSWSSVSILFDEGGWTHYSVPTIDENLLAGKKPTTTKTETEIKRRLL